MCTTWSRKFPAHILIYTTAQLLLGLHYGLTNPSGGRGCSPSNSNIIRSTAPLHFSSRVSDQAEFYIEISPPNRSLTTTFSTDKSSLDSVIFLWRTRLDNLHGTKNVTTPRRGWCSSSKARTRTFHNSQTGVRQKYIPKSGCPVVQVSIWSSNPSF